MYTPPPLETLFHASQPYGMMRWLHYIPIYERHFAPLTTEPIRLLEIGIQGGGSQVMWRRYFHPDSLIVGIDSDPACEQLDTGTEIRIGDQADTDFLQSVQDEFGPFDIIIDDGGHRTTQQLASFETLYPQMAADGVYVIEDTQTALWQGTTYNDRPDGLTILDVAFACCKRLMDWTGVPGNFGLLMSDQNHRLDNAAGDICRSTDSLHFYDSIIVFERQPRRAPRAYPRPALVPCQAGSLGLFQFGGNLNSKTHPDEHYIRVFLLYNYGNDPCSRIVPQV